MARDYSKFANTSQAEISKPQVPTDSSAGNPGGTKTFSAIDPRRDNPPDPNINDSPLWDRLLSITFHREMQDPGSELPLSWALYELRFRGSVLKYVRFEGGTEGYKIYPAIIRTGNWPSQAEYAAEAKRLLAPHGELLREVLAELKSEQPPDL